MRGVSVHTYMYAVKQLPSVLIPYVPATTNVEKASIVVSADHDGQGNVVPLLVPFWLWSGLSTMSFRRDKWI